MTTDDREPLWRVMLDAWACSDRPGWRYRDGYAAEIRALRDELERQQVDTFAVVLPDVRGVLDWLTAEAERAEKGDA